MLLQKCLKCYFDKENRRLRDVGTDSLLVLTVFFSWFLFPVMLKFLAYAQFQVVFLIISISVLVMLVRYSELNRLDWSGWHKWFIFLWAIYLLFLFAASVRSGDLYSLKQFCITLYKVMFFVILLFYMKRNFTVWSFRLYANVVGIIVVFACIVTIGVALEVMEPIKYLTEIIAEQGYGFSVYWGSYYHRGLLIHAPFQLYRMMGFCEEPGTFSLTILPAFIWLLIVDKFYLRTILVGIGILLSFSAGAVYGMLLLLWLFIKQKILFRKVLVCVLVGFCLAAVTAGFPYLASLIAGDLELFIDRLNGFTSLVGRPQSVLSVYEYLLVYPFGTGNALGMATVNYPISVGYANAMLESGVIGGVAYLLMFGLLGWQALKLSLSVDMNQYEGRVCFAVAIAVMVVLFIGLQRQQPDLSLWHMWIYASFFYLTMKKDAICEHDNIYKEAESQFLAADSDR